LCGSRQKDRASPEVRGTGIFGGWRLPCGAARMSFQVKPDRFQQLNQEIICQLSIVF